MSFRIRRSFYRCDRLKWTWMLWLSYYSILPKQEKMANSSSRCRNVSVKKEGAMKEKSQSKKERNVWSKALQVRSSDLMPNFAASILWDYWQVISASYSLLTCQMELLAA